MKPKRSIGLFTKMCMLGSVILAGLGGYIYFLGHTIHPENSFSHKIITGMQNFFDGPQTDKKSFDIQGGFEVQFSNQPSFTGAFVFDNLSMLSQNKGLKQRLTADKVSLRSSQDFIDIQGLDIISENTKHYLYGDAIAHGFDGEIKNYLDIFQKGQYVLLNNQQYIKKYFPSIASNNIFYELLSAVGTAHPVAYLDSIGFKKVVLQNIYADAWQKFLLEEIGKQENKAFYKISDNICSQVDIVSQFIDENLVEYKNICQKNLDRYNKILEEQNYIYTLGERASGNYKLYIQHAPEIYGLAEYKRHILHSWEIKNKQENIFIHFEGNKNKIYSSQIKINTDKISAHIVNGDGKVVIKNNSDKSFVDISVDFQKYAVNHYSANIKHTDDNFQQEFQGKGNFLSGVFGYKKFSGETLVTQLETKYKGLNHSLNLQTKNYKIFSTWKNKNFAFDISKMQDDSINSQLNLVYTHNNLSGFLKTPNINITIEGKNKPKKLQKLSLQGEIKDHKILYIYEQNHGNDGSMRIAAGADLDEKRILDIIFHKYQLGENTNEISITGNFTDIEFTSNINIRKNTAQIDYKKVGDFIEISQMKGNIFLLPNFSIISSYSHLLLSQGVITSSAMYDIWQYITRLQEQKEKQNAEKKKNVDKIFSSIQNLILSGEIHPKDIFGEIQHESKNYLRFGGYKMGYSEKYIVGRLHPDLEEAMNGIINFDAEDYLIGYFSDENNTYFQVASFVQQSPGYAQVYVVGNYEPRELVRYNFKEFIPTDTQEIELSEGQILIQIQQDHDLKIGDNTNLGTILDVTDQYLLLQGENIPGSSKVFLLGDDSPTLFHDKKNNSLKENQIIPYGKNK